MKKIIALFFIFVTSFLTAFPQDIKISTELKSGYAGETISFDERIYSQSGSFVSGGFSFIALDYLKLQCNAIYRYKAASGPYGTVMMRQNNSIGMNFLAGVNVPILNKEKLDIDFSLLIGGGFNYGFYRDSTYFFYPTADVRAGLNFFPDISGNKNFYIGLEIPYSYIGKADLPGHESGVGLVLGYTFF